MIQKWKQLLKIFECSLVASLTNLRKKFRQVRYKKENKKRNKIFILVRNTLVLNSQ